MKQGIKLLVLSRDWSDGKAIVRVGTLFPAKEVFGEAVYSGDTVSADSFEVLLRRAEKLA
ncbi:hypothetical protein A3D45_00840 [Candidatus Falkowbacteria bacterium RIFCSPHIGHO2_02_FULL_42_9]|uniref:Uncharacterized protein n=1 Tax=Candidatus Falkowbacteria bacterium RIFCSPHIGHO2_02_FULL_42_9 TaxID=1797986 RepID=A0A1F5SB08_9BACT|nr:MAG: hypothetical protein A3D45_00840 [Candidatus Falkowbacteria bacterium RIFCSPHIGHO2_02_FULL_42_9]